MEFFSELTSITASPDTLKTQLKIARLPELCASIMSVMDDRGNSGSIYCLWGEFQISREELKYGVRFSLPGCPNALSWSITSDPDSQWITLHLTINKQQHEPDFIESIKQFMADWSRGLEQLHSSKPDA